MTIFFIGNDDYWLYFVDDNTATYCFLKLDSIDEKLDKKMCLKIIDKYEICRKEYANLSMFEVEVKRYSICFDFFANDGRDEKKNRIVKCFHKD